MIERKLSCYQVQKVMDLFYLKKATISKIAQYFKVGYKTIQYIVQGKTYRDCWRYDRYGWENENDFKLAYEHRKRENIKNYGNGRKSPKIEFLLEQIKKGKV